MKLGRVRQIIQEEVKHFLLNKQLEDLQESKDWFLLRPMLKECNVVVGPDTNLRTIRKFRPVYHNHSFAIPGGQPFKVIGSHPPGSEDGAWKVPNPVNPEDRGPKSNVDYFTRIRLVGLDGDFKNKVIFINPMEFQRYFEKHEDDYRANPEMVGDNVPMGEKDPRYTDEVPRMVQPSPIDQDDEKTRYDRPIKRTPKPR